jgi:hypothetical protein
MRNTEPGDTRQPYFQELFAEVESSESLPHRFLYPPYLMHRTRCQLNAYPRPAVNTGTRQGGVNADVAAASAMDTQARQRNLTSRKTLAAAMGIDFKDKGHQVLLRTKVANYFEEHQLPLDKKFHDLERDTMAKPLA